VSRTKQNCSVFKGLRLAVIFLIIGSVFGYVVLVNGSSVKGFEIVRWEQENEKLLSQNKELKEQVENLKSLTQMEERIKNLNLTSVAEIEYLTKAEIVAVVK
jgi:hypothetical protein